MKREVMIRRSIWAGAALLASVALPAYSASFDCSEARSSVERVICADAKLSSADEDLGHAYGAALNAAPDKAARDELRARQQAWLKRRDVCVDAACLMQLYRERIDMLVVQAEKPPNQTRRTASKGGCYRIVVERHRTLCKQWVQNLNLSCDQPPMVCNLKVHPSMKHLFSEPNWQHLDPVAEFKWVETVYRAQWFVLPEEVAAQSQPHQRTSRSWKEIEPEILRKAETGRLKLSRAKFNPLNIPGYGDPIVYRVDDLDCDPQIAEALYRAPTPLLVAIDQNTGAVDDRFRRINEGIHRVLRFKGGYTYLFKWGGDFGDDSLYEPHGSTPLCEFQRQEEQAK